MAKPAVLLVHNRYKERGGEDTAFDAEASLLESRGHRVERLLFDNRELPEEPSLMASLGLGLSTVWSPSGRHRLRDSVSSFAPDVVHFHNTFPQVSPAAYAICHEAGAAVVQTLHNYRLVCANGLFYRDGHPCEDCVGHSLALPALAHACYRGSLPQTAAVASMLAFHRLRGTWQRDVDTYIAPSGFLRDKLSQGGLPAERTLIKPNFLAPDPGPGQHAGAQALFVGRLTPSKGLRTLLEAYRLRDDLPPLRIAGDGELAPVVRAAAMQDERLTYLGRLDRDDVLAEMGDAACLVFPSLWYENFPLTIVEAFARGLPVVASRIGAIEEMVEDGRTGALFSPGDAADLAAKLAGLTADADALSAASSAARCEYASLYTGERNYDILASIYDTALDRVASA